MKAILRDNLGKIALILLYLIGVLVLWLNRDREIRFDHMELLSPIILGIIRSLFPLFTVGGFLTVLVAVILPWGGKAAGENLQRVGLINHAGESPTLIRKRRDREHPRLLIWKFDPHGIPLSAWENKQEQIEAALNLTIIKISWGKDKRRILLYTAPAGNSLPAYLPWSDKCICPDSFVLALGESSLGPVTVDLVHIPHILLGGSTGSGKSVLLKLLLMQCVKKGAKVTIADFKGGVDFPAVWHRHCTMCFEAEELLAILSGLVDELERRKTAFRDAGCPNIDEYNKVTGEGLQRLIFACDEVAEVLDRMGLDKPQKELVGKIEGKLSVIARQGRAFGLHLILATQRPDATILSGQIRNNIDCRVCGRADSVLSQIILDNTDASDRIPKDARGRFLLHDGTVFQGYLFNESTAFKEGLY
ncbi:MAG: type IV secretion system DNA-binding domain-containing protein [Clostridiales bacterium]|nr:type IV secretion system DNA-binding domain-containing protein [Clostridiales bacterium]